MNAQQPRDVVRSKGMLALAPACPCCAAGQGVNPPSALPD